MTLTSSVLGSGCLAVLLLLSSGCGTTDSRENPRDTDYVVVSKGGVSLLYSLFVGGVDYCKVTKHGVPHTSFKGDITFDGDECQVKVEVGDVQE